MKQWAKAVLPPVLLNGLRRVRRLWVPPAFEVASDGWHKRQRGWDAPGVATLERRRWPSYVAEVDSPVMLGNGDGLGLADQRDLWRHNLYLTHAYVFALAARRRETLSVLDWGGSLGHLYLLASSTLADVELDYHVKELPALAAVGRELLPPVCFHEDDSCLQRTYDLVVASSSLHYVDDWEDHFGRLAGATSEYLYVARLPVVLHADSFRVLQRAWEYQTEYVGWALNRDIFLTAARRARLELVREFLSGENPYVHGAPEQLEGRSFLFEQNGHRS